ncbi:MAG: hypothetical protein AAF572_02925 [Cyanobacteria bacterium P01_B01_bin.77]
MYIYSTRTTIATLHKLNYAEPNDWSRPLATGRPGHCNPTD